MITNKVSPGIDVLNSTKKSATIESTFSITSNVTITKKMTEFL